MFSYEDGETKDDVKVPGQGDFGGAGKEGDVGAKMMRMWKVEGKRDLSVVVMKSMGCEMVVEVCINEEK